MAKQYDYKGLREKQHKYWKEREAVSRKETIKSEAEYNKQLQKVYRDTLENIQKEINAFYGKYAKAEGISLLEAKKRVSKLDIEAYQRKAKRYVKEREFSTTANAEMRLYNLTMKVNRLELLKANIGLELVSNFNEIDKQFGKALNEETMKEYKRQASILGEFVDKPEGKADTLVNASFHNATYSTRIWAYQDVLSDQLNRAITQAFLEGKSARALATDFIRMFDVSRSDAERLLRTEIARVRIEAQRQSIEENGFDKYEYIGDQAGVCDVCGDLDAKIFEIKEMSPGKNAPPIHPNCRCSIAPYVDRELFNAWLDSGRANDISLEDFEKEYRVSRPIESSRRTVGQPANVALFGKLSKKQKDLLEALPEYDSRKIVNKKDVSMKDLAALTAATGNEFALFTNKGKRLIIRGDSISVNINEEKAKQLKKQGYKWSGHTHPGTNPVELGASPGDRNILKAFEQKYSSIHNSTGRKIVFAQNEKDDLINEAI